MIVLLLLSVFAASLNSVLLHKVKLSGKGALYKFNLLGMPVWCICLFLANGGRIHLDASTLLWGCIYGMAQALFVLCKAAALNSGPVSVTTLIGNCSLVVSVVVCFLLWDEPVSVADAVGILFLMLGLSLATDKKTGGVYRKGWGLFSLLFLASGAGVGIIFKAFAKNGDAKHTSDMMIVAAFIMLIFYTLTCLFMGSFSSRSALNGKKERYLFVVLALTSGLLSCLYNRLNIYLSGALDGVIFFPSFNGGVVVLSTVLGMLIFKERLSSRQLLGGLFGLVAICIIGVF